MQKTIIVVDDNTSNLAVAQEVLETHYRVVTVSSADKLFSVLNNVTPDLILLDIEMPDKDGFETLKLLKSNQPYAEIPVIFLTSLSEPVNEAYGIELGAVDFIAKPFSEPVLLNRIKYHLYIDAIIHERTEQLRVYSEQLVRLQNGIVHGLADIVEGRDTNTGGHIDRTSEYLKVLFDAMIQRGVYSGEIFAWNQELFISSARLHDVGKIVIPDPILNKPAALTNDEFDIMKTHTTEGGRIIERMVDYTGEAEFLQYAKLSAVYHHERWNGTGYPHALKEADIPLQGRIVAIVDVYDALTSERPYKKPFTDAQAADIIMKDSGKHFDPLIADVFFEIKDQFEKTRNKLKKSGK
jgi:putative two-component system response regulator